MMLTTLRLHERPIDSHDSLAFEFLQRFRERQEARARLVVESDLAEIGSALRRPHGHHPIIFQERLKMPVHFRLLPQSVDLRFSTFLDDNREPRGFDLEELHEKKSPPENYGKEDQTTVAAFLLWRGS